MPFWSKSRIVIASFAFALMVSLEIPSLAFAHVVCERPSCLLVQDINGIRLGMTVQEVADLLPNGLEPLGGGQFEEKSNGVEYNFGFTPLGHLFRIDSSQELGSFIPDRSFGLTLTEKLTAKFGKPHSDGLPDGPAFWDFAEFYADNNGTQLTRETESLSAMLSGGYAQPIKLDMKLMDFRILRQDLAVLNAEPESSARAHIHF